MPQTLWAQGSVSAIEPLVQTKTCGLRAPGPGHAPRKGTRSGKPDFKLCPWERRVLDTGMP